MLFLVFLTITLVVVISMIVVIVVVPVMTQRRCGETEVAAEEYFAGAQGPGDLESTYGHDLVATIVRTLSIPKHLPHLPNSSTPKLP
jgi:hypothetical protein